MYNIVSAAEKQNPQRLTFMPQQKWSQNYTVLNLDSIKTERNVSNNCALSGQYIGALFCVLTETVSNIISHAYLYLSSTHKFDTEVIPSLCSTLENIE